MRLCDNCKEPATRTAVIVKNRQKITNHYCYAHAVEASALHIDASVVNTVSAKTGYSLNAIFFIIESLLRGGCLIEAQEDTSNAYELGPSKLAIEFCICIGQTAVKRFQQEAGLVMTHWGLNHGSDVGRILQGLVESRGLIVREVRSSNVIEELLAIEAPLLEAA